MKKLFLFTAIIATTLFVDAQNFKWAKGIGGTSIDRAQCIETDASGNVYIAGAFSDSVDFDPGTGIKKLGAADMRDAFLAKYNSAGDFIWAFSFGDTYDDEILDLKIDNEGNIIVTGSFMGTIDLDPGTGTTNVTSVMSNNDGFLAKYNSSGNFIWGFSFGSSANDYGKHIQINSNNDIYLDGYFNQSVDFDPGNGNTSLTGTFDIFVAKYDKNANFIWAFKIGANGQEGSHGLALDVHENIIIQGRFQQTVDFDPGSGTTNLTASSNHDLFFAKYTKNGNFVWVKQLSGPSSKYGQGISTDADSNIYISGSFGSSMDMDPSGNTVNASSPGTSPFVVKYNAQGDYQWHTVFTSTGGNAASGNVQYYNGNVYVIGTFSNAINVTVGGNPANLTSSGAEDIFISKLDASNGNIIWINNAGATDLDYGNAIKVLNNDVFYICGTYSGSCDFNFDSQQTNNISSNGLNDIFIAKYDIWGVGINENNASKNAVKIYPNPINANTSLKIDSKIEVINEVIIYDLFGRIVYNQKINPANSISIPVALNQGLYIVTIKTKSNVINTYLEVVY